MSTSTQFEDDPNGYGIGLDVLDLDEYVASMQHEPIIGNHLDSFSEEGRERINRLLYTTHDGEFLSPQPECGCGIKHYGWLEGTIHEPCGTLITTTHSQLVESRLVLQRPQGIEAFINPLVWAIMHKALKKSQVSMLDWLVSTDYNTNRPLPPELLRVEKEGIPRGLNSFYNNFDQIMKLLLVNPRTGSTAKGKLSELKAFVAKFRDRIFCRHLPMPSNLLFVMNQTEHGRNADSKLMSAMIDGFNNICAVSQNRRMMKKENGETGREMVVVDQPLHATIRQNQTVRAIAKIALFYEKFIKDMYCGQSGIARKQQFGGRSHFTARAVITSITGPCHYEDIYLPWGLSVQLFRLHIAAVLIKQGYSARTILMKLNHAVLWKDPEVYEILNWLIANSPHKGPRCLFQRNPTLAKAASQMFHIHVKEDIRDPTISMPPQCLVGPNADFDGDEMNLSLSLDAESDMYYERLSASASAIDLSAAYSISRNLKMPTPLVASATNWLHGNR